MTSIKAAVLVLLIALGVGVCSTTARAILFSSAASVVTQYVLGTGTGTTDCLGTGTGTTDCLGVQ
jgi:hypothetical protein